MQLLINGLIAGSLAALIAGGLALVYGVSGATKIGVSFKNLVTLWGICNHGGMVQRENCMSRNPAHIID